MVGAIGDRVAVISAYFLLLFQLLHQNQSLTNGETPYTWREKEKYYYPSIDIKMREMLSGHCKESYLGSKNSQTKLPQNAANVTVSLFPVSKLISKWWVEIDAPRQMRISPLLCEVPYTKLKPFFNNSGCVNPVGYMVQSGPRCQIGYLKWICDMARMPLDMKKGNGFILPESHHSKLDFSPPVPYLLTAKDSFVSMCGQIVNKCGLLATTANCMATIQTQRMGRFTRICTHKLLEEKGFPEQPEGSVLSCPESTPFSSDITSVNRLFVVAEADDTHVYHVHLEIMPRIIYHMDFLKSNPDIRILVGCDTMPTPERTKGGLEKGLRAMSPFMSLIGIPMSRLIVHKNTYAKEVYLPMEGGCQDPVYNTWHLLHMRRLFMEMAGLDPFRQSRLAEIKSGRRRPVMLLIKRSHGSAHTRNSRDLVRQWSNLFTELILQKLRDRFPSFEVQLFTDRNSTLMSCHLCQVRAVEDADVMVGMHGAGLSNMLYMRPNSAVVEFAPYGNDGRCLLGGGPFSRLATLLGHNYLMHHPPADEYKWRLKESVAEFNVEAFVEHIHSFLMSIDLVRA